MQNNWYILENLEANPEGSIGAQVVVPPDSPWFSGHFPGNPVLPAVAQLAIVQDVIQKATGPDRIFKAVNRIKYRRIIRPDELINISVTPIDSGKGNYSFNITVNEEIACKGRVRTDLAE